MQIYPCMLSLYTLTYPAKNKGRVFYGGGPNLSQQSESIRGCVSCSWVMESPGHQNSNRKDRIQTNIRLPTQKKRIQSKQEVAVRTSFVMRTETASHWFSLKAMQPRVWNQSCPPTDELSEICHLPEHMDPEISQLPHLWSQISVKGYFMIKIKLIMIIIKTPQRKTYTGVVQSVFFSPVNNGLIFYFMMQVISHKAIYVRC